MLIQKAAPIWWLDKVWVILEVTDWFWIMFYSLSFMLYNRIGNMDGLQEGWRSFKRGGGIFSVLNDKGMEGSRKQSLLYFVV